MAGNLALVGVNTSQDFTQPSGFLAVVDVLQRRIIRKIPLTGQPDSVAVGPRKRFLAIAIENERDEDLVVNGVEGGLPLPHLREDGLACQKLLQWTRIPFL